MHRVQTLHDVFLSPLKSGNACEGGQECRSAMKAVKAFCLLADTEN